MIAMLIATTAVGGCAARLPVLAQTGPVDDAMSCSELNRGISRAVQVRAQAIEEAKVTVINEMIGARNRSAQVVIGIVAIGVPVPDNNIRHYDLAWHAAEARLHRLLTLKRDRLCPDRDLGDGELTERKLLARLEEVDRQVLAGEVSLRERASQRQDLFNYFGVRPNNR
ncbi:MAG: hypothetical protein AB8B96_19880 [Lysobacterales bacterium]